MTNNPHLEGKGIAEKTAGKVKNKVGHAESLGKQILFHP